MADHARRAVTLTRLDTGIYEARNARGTTLRFGSMDDEGFSPVELLLAAIAGCSAVDIDAVTGRHATPERFDIEVTANKVRDDDGNHLQDLSVTFHLAFPEGDGGDRARRLAPRAARTSREVSCTVSRTIELGAPVAMAVEVAMSVETGLEGGTAG